MNKHEDYYYFAQVGGIMRKMTYKQYIVFGQTSPASVHRALKKDYNALDKATKGVLLKDRTSWIFNRLHSERKKEGGF